MMKLKIIWLVIGLLTLGSVRVFAQEEKKDSLSGKQIIDTLTPEQKQAYLEECKAEILKMLGAMMINSDGDGEMEKHRIDSILRTVNAKYKAGVASADFKFRDINGKVYSLKDFRGKYVYIDIWATWCGPCCKEIPFLQQLEEKMQGKKIVFVSISWDRKRENWTKMLDEQKMGGTQLHYNGDETFMKEYGVEFIPRFILLDKKGRVIDAYMTRPSEPETEETLKSLKGI